MKRILVIDGNSIINRAFYGIRALTNASGQPTNAIYGLINIVSRQLDEIKPDYAAAAFDLKTPTFRKKLYEGYKATRHPTPPDLLAQFDGAKECLEHMGVHTVSLEGYEADDLLGTLARRAEDSEELHAYILSGDRDLLQLISDKVSVLLVKSGETIEYDTARFVDDWGIQPLQLIDAKALMGDSSDNIPGVPGIGEKTALKLISEFGSLDGVYENLDSDSITPSVKKKLAAGEDSARLSYVLSRIDVDVPIEAGLDFITYGGINPSALYRKFKEYEFFSLIKKFGLTETEDAPVAQKQREAAEYRQISPDELADALGERIAIETADDGGLAITCSGRHLTVSSDDSDRALGVIFSGGVTDVTCQDWKSLLCRLHRLGIEPDVRPFDLMLAAYVVDSNKKNSLEASLRGYLGEERNEFPRTDLMDELRETLETRLRECGGEYVYYEIEIPIATVLAEMQESGFRIDREGLSAFGDQLLARIGDQVAAIYELVGYEFNLNSPKQLGEVLYERLGLPCPKKKKTGYPTDVETLTELSGKHPIIDMILEYRQLSKLHSTYIVGLLKATDESDFIHTEFNQALTATGRLSSSEPNLQNIPIRTPLGRSLRRFFLPSAPGRKLIDADYSQIELRLLAHLSGDREMTDAFSRGVDIHTRTAAAVFGVEEDEVTPEQRQNAKAVNFGIVYGNGSYSLSRDLGTPVAHAKHYIDSYLSLYSGVDAYLSRTVEEAREQGYVETLFGRRRYIPELSSSNRNLVHFGERVAMNSPVQGTAADIMKLALLGVRRRLLREGLDARIIMQVHDELILDASAECAERAAEILVAEMESATELDIPLTVEVEVGDNWYL